MEKMNNVRIDPSDDEREKIPPCQEVDDSCSEMSGAPESCGFSPSLGSLESGQITISSEQFEAVVGLKERCDAQEEKLRALSEMRENEAKKADRTIEEFELKLREKDFALAEKEHELKAKTDALERSSLDLRQILEKSGKDSKKIYQMQASIELLKEEVAKWKDAVLKDTPENEDRSNKKKIRQLVLANQIANAKLKRHKTMLEHARNDILQQAEVIKNQNEVLSQLQAPDSSFKGELTKDTNVSLSLSEDMHVSEIKMHEKAIKQLRLEIQDRETQIVQLTEANIIFQRRYSAKWLKILIATGLCSVIFCLLFEPGYEDTQAQLF